MFHKVIPIYNGNFTVKFDKFSELAIVKDVNFNIHNFIFLIIDEYGDAVVVDTGFSNDHIYGFESIYDNSRDFSIKKNIADHGYDTGKIKNVILTHIHWDHTGGMEYFPKAEFHVQVQDFTTLLNLLPDEETAYTPHHWLPCLPRMHLVDGECELKPGLKMIFSGWHSPGHQIIEVDTVKGKVIIAGDEMTNHKKFWESIPYEYWETMRERYYDKFYWTHKHLPSLEKWLKENYSRPVQDKKILRISDINKMGKFILFSHDENLLKIKSIP